MVWLGLTLGVIALWVAIGTRLEQDKQQREIDRLRSMLIKAGPTQSSKPVEPERPDRPAEAPPTTDEVKPSIPGEAQALDHKPQSQPLSQRKQALHRVAGPTSAKMPQATPDFITKSAATESTATPRKQKASLEEIIGAKLYIWAAGICLMLAGAFLVKFSFDRQLLSVGVRLSIAAGFGVALVLTSLWARGKSERIGAALCGAGVADLFATVLAATAYYELLNPWLGFSVMAAVTALAVGMSLVHGPYVALLALVGGFVTPALISGHESAWGTTFTYLLLLEFGLMAVARRRSWFGLSALTLVASLVWALVYTLFAWSPESRLYMIMFVLGTSVLFVLSAARSMAQDPEKRTPLGRLWLAVGAAGSGAMLLSLLVAYSQFSVIELSALGLLAAGSLVLARLDLRYLAVTFLSAALCAAMMLAWPIAHQFLDAPFEPGRFYLVVIGYGGVFTLGGMLSLWRNRRPTCFAWLSASAALVFTAMAHVGAPHDLPEPLRWWMVYTGIGVLLTGAAVIVWRSRQNHGTRLIDAYALIATAMATIAVGVGIDLPWIAPAWAGLALAASMIDRRLTLPNLRIAVGWLTGLCLLLLMVPGPTGYELGGRVVLNRMMIHYGLPAACFGLIAWLYRRGAPTWLRDIYQALGLLVAAVAVTLQVRYGFHPSGFVTAAPVLNEWAAYAVLWMGVCVTVLWRFTSPTLTGLRIAGAGLGAAGLAGCVVGLLLIANPLITRTDLGNLPVLNWLLFAYGVPCVLSALVMWVSTDQLKPLKILAALVSFFMLFALVTLEVRQGFVGADLTLASHAVGSAENYTYSLSWVLLGIGLLVAGLINQSRALRYGSLAIMLIAVGKVFIMDTAHLRDLWRVLSFLGLGLSLMALGYVYQRFVFGKQPKGADES